MSGKGAHAGSASRSSLPVRASFDLPARGLVAIFEHALELLLDHPLAEPIADAAQRGLVLDLVAQERPAAAVVEEQMAVIPPQERPRILAICERAGRIVLRVDRNPLDRNCCIYCYRKIIFGRLFL